ncbi:carboxylating nicotinate-nucleotide diphosphorylase [Xylanibacillus composti]|uniref:Probable nicotinate-nucleotide pyrophosphorylase [carboxylating] n=1 Tax=Xylanibacillus composti TaxID=1572762 RepID=A0A8J4M0Z2_9BACL|nr:carboxylating nicotinate-nucleotide diphosphorylase [Xylanibacillus composti]MDT9725115.1 carboxylating nicotinate-nucleotide diphosphorylase [Xylanibacillus composti]GIQ67312.1 nicotinate-nucleotide diphosphorylase (carboxylating) [Xylanibacillus composti]
MKASNQHAVRRMIQEWLMEDIGTGDVTTDSVVPRETQAKAIIHAKQEGVLAGVEVAQWVFHEVDPSISFRALMQDGDPLRVGDIIAEAEGSARSLLLGERLALNLLQRMSGIATKSRRFAEAVEGLPVRVVDTRKTTPGHRLLEKYAVRVGGAHNHRFGLYDAVMIKDNHIKAAGGIEAAVQAARAAIPHTMKIEVEVEQAHEVEQALQAGADIIMLDNMPLADMRAAVARIREQAPHVVIEASGGVTLDTVRAIAETGVDVISAGGLTASVSTLDISLDLNERKERRI